MANWFERCLVRPQMWKVRHLRSHTPDYRIPRLRDPPTPCITRHSGQYAPRRGMLEQKLAIAQYASRHRTAHHAPRTTHHAPCTMHRATCTMHHAPCSARRPLRTAAHSHARPRTAGEPTAHHLQHTPAYHRAPSVSHAPVPSHPHPVTPSPPPLCLAHHGRPHTITPTSAFRAPRLQERRRSLRR